MEYYQCSTEALRQEVQRRTFTPYGGRDQLSERLQSDDDERGSEATTVATEDLATRIPPEVDANLTGNLGQTFPANQLVNQNIVYWSLNTCFPNLQLFFESGFSCTIDGGRLPGAVVGLDSNLHFHLTNCTHEEQGRLVKGIIPESLAYPIPSITILEATVARRTSIGVKPMNSTDQPLGSKVQRLGIVREVHTVIGLRLKGMSEMGYVWVKTEVPFRTAAGRIWGDVRLFGLRNDVPAPFLGLAAVLPMAERESKVVEKDSIISAIPGGLDDSGRPWI